ncbi:hypothetical protein WMY93_007647 [Mugilogobius chulae]|uniref:G-protein coupled receptors family 1 profile domain-containing protein n=1 Tax=Mugilogobius chulae TaxID=88201 RepID=A0AAW0PGN9_9GOBI
MVHSHRRWTLQRWSQVVFSDEKMFQCFRADGRDLVYRRRWERLNLVCANCRRMDSGSNSSSVSSYDFLAARLLATVTSSFCCLFFVINITILFTLRSKAAFSQCPRYVLLFNLVLADTVLMAQAQTLYLLANLRVYISYPLCISLSLVSYMTSQISPYTLILMSLERWIAVSFPFRHPTIVSLRKTYLLILSIWTVSCLNVLLRVLFVLEFSFHKLADLLICSAAIIQISPKNLVYDRIYTYVLFTSSALIILSSFVAVMVVACLASGNKAQLNKARTTLLIHLFQLSLNLLSVMSPQVFVLASKCCGGTPLLAAMYVLVILLPRCLSALVYGLRDSASDLCCGLTCAAGCKSFQRNESKQASVFPSLVKKSFWIPKG